MEICSKTGKDCLYLSVARSVNMNSVITKEDGTPVSPEVEADRLAIADGILEYSEKLCTEDECGVLANIAAISLQSTVALQTGASIKYRQDV